MGWLNTTKKRYVTGGKSEPLKSLRSLSSCVKVLEDNMITDARDLGRMILRTATRAHRLANSERRAYLYGGWGAAHCSCGTHSDSVQFSSWHQRKKPSRHQQLGGFVSFGSPSTHPGRVQICAPLHQSSHPHSRHSSVARHPSGASVVVVVAVIGH